MELLGRIIYGKCASGDWKPIKALSNRPAFSNLFIADDLLLFARADSTNCRSVRDAIDEFCMVFGQKVNTTKSKVYFSSNIEREQRMELCNILGFRSTANLGSYPGFPLRHASSSNQDLSFIIDRVKQKLVGWKANLLSFAGHRILIQASISAIPSYVMQINHLPSRISDNLDRLSRNFLWGTCETKRKIHWIGWAKVTRPKEEGGLGLQTTKGRNLVYLAKPN
ncbi:hypothetical protein ACB092_02G172800 [Castanea dentata]